MNRQTNGSDGNKRLEPEASSSPLASGGADGHSPRKTKTDLLPIDRRNLDHDQLIAELKRNLEQTRLPPDLKEQILAELPPPEEQERLFRELQEKGGMSFEQFMESLGVEVHPQP